MCGIFGLHNNLDLSKKDGFKILSNDLELYSNLSKERGVDAYGVAFKINDKNVLYKLNENPTKIHKRSDFKSFLNNQLNQKSENFSFIGQNRLVTNGLKSFNENIQPIITENIIGIHNGILSNIQKFKNNDAENLKSDSHILFNFLSEKFNNKENYINQFLKIIRDINGNFSIALFLQHDDEMFLSSNCGSLYYYYDKNNNFLTFASEKNILKNFLNKSHIVKKNNYNIDITKICQLLNKSLVFNSKKKELKILDNNKLENNNQNELKITQHKKELVYNLHEDRKRHKKLNRCSKCVLPETYPQIKFDEKGVCNYCNSYQKQVFLGEEKLEKIFRKYRKNNGEADCLFGLSGGRDSCYALHLIKKKYKMTPIAYTYDWGLTTDVSRVNSAKICGKLGIEHIIRSADIEKKRDYVSANLNAWLKKPHLGMLPIIQAGDKEFITYGRKIAKELNLDLIIHGAGYQLEQREFFLGFTGINQKIKNNQPTVTYDLANKIRLFFWYSSQFIKNYHYLNKATLDNLKGFLITFFYKHNFLEIYDYEKWDEELIIRTLNDEYDWENDIKYGSNQWRVGDGQTSLNNFIYYNVAGFSEFDNFRSNQIREGLITRDEAIKLCEKDNEIKTDNIKNLSEIVGFNFDNVIAKIKSIPKIY